MISLQSETLIPVSEAPKHLPSRPSGKRVHISAVYRWIVRGVKGVRLESLKIGGGTYTSLEALQRFADALTARASPTLRMPTPNCHAIERRRRWVASRLEIELELPPGHLADRGRAINAPAESAKRSPRP